MGRYAANDNVSGAPRRKSARYKEIEAEIRYELEGDLIEAMDSGERARYRKSRAVPFELKQLSQKIEAAINQAVQSAMEHN